MQQRNGRTGTPHNASENTNSTSTILEKSVAQILPVESPQIGSGGINSLMPIFLRGCHQLAKLGGLAGKELDTAGNPEEGSRNKHASRATELPIVIGLPCAEMGSSGKPGSTRNRPSSNMALISLDHQRHQVFDFTTGEITVGDKYENSITLHII